MTLLLGSYVAAFLTALALVPACRYFAREHGYVARPTRDRWNTRSTPMLGGVALSVTVLGLMVVVGQPRPVWVLLLTAGLMFAVGLADDLRSLKPSTKLIAEIAIASLLVFFGYRLQWVETLTGDTLLTLVWIVGITNAFNLLDNMDGLCAGVTLIAGVSLLVVYAGGSPQPPELVYLSLLLGATTAFLVYNLHPASVFLGDSGSLFIGVSLATLALDLESVTSGQPSVLSVIAVPAFVLLIPIFDTTLVTLSRLLSGRAPATGGRDHSSHRLVAIGLSERTAVAVLWALAALGGAVGVLTNYVSPGWSGLLGALLLLVMAIFAVYLSQVRVYEDGEPDGLSSGTITPLVVNFIYKRRVAEIVLDVCLVSVAYYAAYRLRFEGNEWSRNFPLFLQSLPIVVGVQMLALFSTGAYQGVWRYFTLIDSVVFAKAVVLGTTAVVVVLVFGYRFEDYSRTVFVIYAVLLMFLVMGFRSSFRLLSELILRGRSTGERLVVYGVDGGGVAALRNLAGEPDSRCRMVGFIDDDATQHGRRLHGYAVLGGYEKLLSLILSDEVDTVVLCANPVDTARLHELNHVCEARGVTLARMQVGMQRIVAS